MLNPETLRRIRLIELRTRRLVNNTFAGAYHSVFKGQGMTFEAVRPYQPGDDIRRIDWNVTARADQAFIKQYAEERELTVMLLLDSSASSFFGTVGRQKRDLAAELGAVLALAAVSNNDKVGLMVFSDEVEQFTPPRKGRNHVLRVIRDLLVARPERRGTDIALALQTTNRLLKQRAIIFILSDFLISGQEYVRQLMVTNRKHDVIAVVLSDPLEKRFPSVGLVALKDAETDETRWVDTTLDGWSSDFQSRSERFQEMRDANLVRAGVDRMDLSVDGDYVRVLTEFFQRRARRMSR